MKNKAICPNCGAEGTAGRFCEYCGTKIPMPKPKRKKKSVSDVEEAKCISEFQTLEEDAVEKMLHRLTETENLPVDFFQKCQVDEIKPYYVPVYYYQCSFEAPWSCVKLVTKEYEVYNHSTKRNEKRKTTERYPMNGVAMDSFSYITCAGKKEDIPEELYDFINNEMKTYGDAHYDNSTERELTEEEQALLVEDGELSQNALWKQNCEIFLDARVSRGVRSQLPNSYENLSYSYTYRNPCHYMILPFWMIRYSYKGKKYLFITDGLLKQVRIHTPIDKKQASKSEDMQNNLKRAGDSSAWSIFYFILFSLATVIMSALSRSVEHVTWELPLSAVFMLLTLINGHRANKRIKEKKKLQATLTAYQNEVWMQRKKQLLSALSRTSFGMTAPKVKEFGDLLQKEMAKRKLSVDANANSRWIKIMAFIVFVIFGACLIVTVVDNTMW